MIMIFKSKANKINNLKNKFAKSEEKIISNKLSN